MNIFEKEEDVKYSRARVSMDVLRVMACSCSRIAGKKSWSVLSGQNQCSFSSDQSQGPPQTGHDDFEDTEHGSPCFFLLITVGKTISLWVFWKSQVCPSFGHQLKESAGVSKKAELSFPAV